MELLISELRDYQCRRLSMQVWSSGQEDPLEKETATYSSILAWKIPWTKEAGRLQSMGLQRVGHNREECSLYQLLIFTYF